MSDASRPPASAERARSPVLRPIRISSNDVAPNQLQSYWQDHLCRHVIQSHCSQPDGHELFFDLLHYPLPQAGLTWLRDSPQRVTRAQEHIGRASAQHVVVMVQHAGESHISCRGDDMVLRPGDVGLVADWRPSITSATAVVTQSVLMIPLDQWRHSFARMPDLSVIRLDREHHSTQLIQAAMHSTFEQLREDANRLAADHFVQSMMHALLGACVAQDKLPTSSGSRLERYYFEQMEEYILRHLDAPDTTPTAVAASVGLSAAHAQRLYRNAGMSISRSVRQKRLRAAQQDMLNPALRHVSIQEVAYRWGFYDAAHFSHAFRAEFGMAPAAWRRKHIGQ